MAELQLTKTRIQAGVWEGVLTGAETAPEIDGDAISASRSTAPTVREDPEEPGQFLVRVPIPVELLSRGSADLRHLRRGHRRASSRVSPW